MEGAKRPPFPRPPDCPAGITQSDFGSTVIGWGTGYEEALDRKGKIDLDRLKAFGVTKKLAEEWRDFYLEVIRLRQEWNQGNMIPDSPEGRAELMQHIVDLFDKQ